IGAQVVHCRERRVTGASGVVLVSDRGSEERHHAVPGELVDRSGDSVHRRAENFEDPIENAMPVLGVEAAGESHRIDHVDEEDADLPALAFARAPGREDFVGKVTWSVGACRRSRRRALGRQERGAARTAEMCAVARFVLTAGARHPKDSSTRWRTAGQPATFIFSRPTGRYALTAGMTSPVMRSMERIAASCDMRPSRPQKVM